MAVTTTGTKAKPILTIGVAIDRNLESMTSAANNRPKVTSLLMSICFFILILLSPLDKKDLSKQVCQRKPSYSGLTADAEHHRKDYPFRLKATSHLSALNAVCLLCYRVIAYMITYYPLSCNNFYFKFKIYVALISNSLIALCITYTALGFVDDGIAYIVLRSA